MLSGLFLGLIRFSFVCVSVWVRVLVQVGNLVSWFIIVMGSLCLLLRVVIYDWVMWVVVVLISFMVIGLFLDVVLVILIVNLFRWMTWLGLVSSDVVVLRLRSWFRHCLVVLVSAAGGFVLLCVRYVVVSLWWFRLMVLLWLFYLGF